MFWTICRCSIKWRKCKGRRVFIQTRNAYRTAGSGGFQLPATAAFGANPPNGAVVHYYLKAKPKEISLEFLESSGKINSQIFRQNSSRRRTAARTNRQRRRTEFANGNRFKSFRLELSSAERHRLARFDNVGRKFGGTENCAGRLSGAFFG